MNLKDLISIIIPVYNRATLISQTLESIISQDFHNWECILVDDGSTDGSQEVIKDFQKKDKRFKFFNRPKSYPKGANACRNFGYENSTGNYIHWFDSDDIMASNKLSKQYNHIQSNSLEASVCNFNMFFETPKRLSSHHANLPEKDTELFSSFLKTILFLKQCDAFLAIY